MSGRSSILALRDALRSVALQQTAHEPDRQREIREHVHRVVDELKSVGWPADRINLALKEIAIDAGLHPSRAIIVHTSPSAASDALLANVLRWSLERFYSASSES